MIKEVGARFDVPTERPELLPCENRGHFANMLAQMNLAAQGQVSLHVPRRHVRTDAERIRIWAQTGRMPAGSYWK